MNTYETVFIMNPVLSEDQVKETVQKFVGHIKTNKGAVTHEENWGLKKLKYAIQKKKTGFYYLLEIQADGEIINDFEVSTFCVILYGLFVSIVNFKIQVYGSLLVGGGGVGEGMTDHVV